MQTTVATQGVYIALPESDVSFLRALSNRMGWTMKKERKSGIEKGLEDIRIGNVYHAKDSADLIQQILN